MSAGSQPRLYEWITLEPAPGRLGELAGRVASAIDPARAIACWHTLVGGPPRVYVLSEIDPQTRLDNLHEPAQSGFGFSALGTLIKTLSVDHYRGLPCFPFVDRKATGAIYEMRYYDLQPFNALDAAIDGWASVIGARLNIAPITAVMHTLEGKMPRLLHLYPYESLAHREEIRKAAVATGVWPPKGGASRNLIMRSEILAPVPL